jgi:hypothetical protein
MIAVPDAPASAKDTRYGNIVESPARSSRTSSAGVISWALRTSTWLRRTRSTTSAGSAWPKYRFDDMIRSGVPCTGVGES